MMMHSNLTRIPILIRETKEPWCRVSQFHEEMPENS